MSKSKLPTRRSALLGTLGPVLLSACGGGGSADVPAPVPPAPTPPEITQQPIAATAAAGTSVSFAVGVRDSGGASFQWLRDGAEIAGATAASFTYAPVSLLDAKAVFSVRIINAGGSVTSQGAELSVTSASMTILAGVVDQPGYVDAVGSAARFDYFASIAVDDAGNAYEGTGPVIRKVTPDGTVTTFAGSRTQFFARDGRGTDARFHSITGLTYDRNRGVLVLLDYANLPTQPLPQTGRFMLPREGFPWSSQLRIRSPCTGFLSALKQCSWPAIRGCPVFGMAWAPAPCS